MGARAKGVAVDEAAPEGMVARGGGRAAEKAAAMARVASRPSRASRRRLRSRSPLSSPQDEERLLRSPFSPCLPRRR